MKSALPSRGPGDLNFASDSRVKFKCPNTLYKGLRPEDAGLIRASRPAYSLLVKYNANGQTSESR